VQRTLLDQPRLETGVAGLQVVDDLGTVAPLASTDFSPPVWVRRMVGMETMTAMLKNLRSGC